MMVQDGLMINGLPRSLTTLILAHMAISRMRSADDRHAGEVIGARRLSRDTTDGLNSGAVIAVSRQPEILSGPKASATTRNLV
jgi:hypothetical protein